MSNIGIRRVIVAGRDAALWLSAATLGRALRPAGIEVEAVELPSALDRASSYASLPALEALHHRIGLEESVLLRLTGGSFSFGHNFVAGGDASPSFFHSWSAYGSPIEGRPFLPFWLKARALGMTADLQDFCPAAVAAKHGRLLLPDDETDAFGRVDYGYHFPALAYVDLLRRVAAKLGIVRHPAQSIACERRSDGAIVALLHGGDRRIEGDLFIDAGGSDAALIGGGPDAFFEDRRDRFAVDRVLSARAPALGSIPPYAEQRACASGWLRLQPDQRGTSVVFAYNGGLTNDATALAEARAASGLQLADASVAISEPGRRASPWSANCIAIGKAAVGLDPIHGAELQLIQSGLVHLLARFPAHADMAAERNDYNQIMASLSDRIVDFQAAAYHCAPYAGPFWDLARRSSVSPELMHKIATFRVRGDIAPMEDETFLADSWQALLIGMGVVPESWAPTIDRIAPERIKDAFGRIFAFIGGKVSDQPMHDAYLHDLQGSVAA